MSTITRDEWQRRYAARIMEVSGALEHAAMEIAQIGADEYERMELEAGCTVDWSGPMSPEDCADDEMSYWDNDE